MYIAPWRLKIQRRSDDRELNQARSKSDTVDWPVKTARTIVCHYIGTQYCSTETVLLIFPSKRPSHLRCGQVDVQGHTENTNIGTTMNNNLYLLYLLVQSSNVGIRLLRSFFQLHDGNHRVCVVGQDSHHGMDLTTSHEPFLFSFTTTATSQPHLRWKILFELDS